MPWSIRFIRALASWRWRLTVPEVRPVRSTISASERSRKYRMATAPRCAGVRLASASRTALRSSFRIAAASGSVDSSSPPAPSAWSRVVVRSRCWTALMASLTTILWNHGLKGRVGSYCCARSKTRTKASLTTSSASGTACVTRYAARSALVWYRLTSLPRALISPSFIRSMSCWSLTSHRPSSVRTPLYVVSPRPPLG